MRLLPNLVDDRPFHSLASFLRGIQLILIYVDQTHVQRLHYFSVSVNFTIPNRQGLINEPASPGGLSSYFWKRQQAAQDQVSLPPAFLRVAASSDPSSCHYRLRCFSSRLPAP